MAGDADLVRLLSLEGALPRLLSKMGDLNTLEKVDIVSSLEMFVKKNVQKMPSFGTTGLKCEKGVFWLLKKMR